MDGIAVLSGFGVGAIVGMTGVGHATLGHADWSLPALLLIGSVPGIWLGAQLTRSLPERIVRSLLGGALVNVGPSVIR